MNYDSGNIYKVKKALKEGGIGLIFSRFFKKSFQMNHAYWFERDLSVSVKKYSAKIPVEVNMHGYKETLKWLESEDRCWMLEYGDEIKIGIEQGHFYPNIKHKGKIIGSAKVGFGNVYIPDFKKVICFPDKITYHTDIYIDNEYRRKGVAQYFLNEIINFLKDQGFKKHRCHIPTWNKASIKAHGNVGFKKVNHIYYFNILGIKFLSANPGYK